MLLGNLAKDAEMKYEVYLPEGYSSDKKYPLCFAMYGDPGNIDEFKGYWKGDVFLKRNFIFAYIQLPCRYFYDEGIIAHLIPKDLNYRLNQAIEFILEDNKLCMP